MKDIYTLDELHALPTIRTASTGNLKVQTKFKRIWLSRMTIEDGADYNNQVTVERCRDGSWYPAITYQAK
jgi:hypothetical protein